MTHFSDQNAVPVNPQSIQLTGKIVCSGPVNVYYLLSWREISIIESLDGDERNPFLLHRLYSTRQTIILLARQKYLIEYS